MRRTESLRTLTFGDRTISYDTGLNFSSSKTAAFEDTSFQQRMIEPDDSVPMRSPLSEVDSGAGSDISEPDQDAEQLQENFKGVRVAKQLIKPDILAMSQLLNFNEEDEEDLSESDDEEDDTKDTKRNRLKWKKAIVKDLSNLSCKSSKLSRRHSITVCESQVMKSGVTSTQNEKGKKDVWGNQRNTGMIGGPVSLPFQSSENKKISERPVNLATLDLNLEEMAHIRSVLTKAELEAMSVEGNIRADLESGRLCFLCMNTRFGIFSRSQKCQICKQNVCSKCVSKMRIPSEQFAGVPVQVLTPLSPLSPTSPQPTPLNSLISTNLDNCAGSAPSSPKSDRKQPPSQLDVNKLEEQLESLPDTHYLDRSASPLTPPPITGRWPALGRSATLPTKKVGRRWSVLESARAQDREKLEGSLLIVCLDCKQMILQVIRSKGISRRVKQKIKHQEEQTRL